MVTDVLMQSNVTTFIYSPAQPLATVKRHLIVVPEKAEKEAGFQAWVHRIRQLAENSGAKIVFFASEGTHRTPPPPPGPQTPGRTSGSSRSTAGTTSPRSNTTCGTTTASGS